MDDRGYKPEYREWPSVTELIPKPNFFVSAELLEECRIEGVTNHAMIDEWFKSGKTHGDKYVEQFAEFWEKHKSEYGDVVLRETPLYNIDLKYKGTPDIVCKNAIIDIKRSRGDSKMQALQLAGYDDLAAHNGIIHGERDWFIIFYERGKFMMKDVFNYTAYRTFHSLVKKWWAEKEIDEYMERVKK